MARRGYVPRHLRPEDMGKYKRLCMADALRPVFGCACLFLAVFALTVMMARMPWPLS